MEQDPLGYVDATNLYASSAPSALDPSGLEILSPCKIDDYLKENNVPFKEPTKSASFFNYKGLSVYDGRNLESEILSTMISSKREFILSPGGGGISPSENCVAALKSHVAARVAIVKRAAQKNYGFGAGEDFKVNPAFWTVNYETGRYGLQPGKTVEQAIADVFKNSSEYKVSCYFATSITMNAGGSSIRDFKVDLADWVPGDWGYIKNDKQDGKTAGLEGENIIFVGWVSKGDDKGFWGHFGDKNTYKPLVGEGSWQETVQGWNNGTAPIENWRERPRVGLKDPKNPED
jgi:hypothetical protein